MMLYTRQQLLLVLLFVGAAGAGLAIDHWRRAEPERVEQLERLDRTERATAPETAAPDRRPAREIRRALREARPRERAARERDATAEPPERARRSRERVAPPAERASRDKHGAPPDTPLDVNRADAPELARLPGIGPTLAARIVGARPFAALDDLARVRGLRRATLERLRPLLTLGGSSPS